MNMDLIFKNYQCGNYKYCLELIEERSLQSESDRSILAKEQLANLNSTSAGILLESNRGVCQAIMESEKEGQKWIESLHIFVKLYTNYKSLQVIPLELEMNVIYNMLWWFWNKPQRCTTHSLKSILKSLSCCLIKVLRASGEVILGQQLCLDDISTIVNLLKRTSDQLLCLTPVACIQLLDIVTITVQVLLGERNAEATADCRSMMERIVTQIDLLKLHTERKQADGSEELYFKFGLTCINSTASLKNCKDSIDAFVITSGLVCAVNEEYEQAIVCLRRTYGAESSFGFITQYLKAHCYLMSQNYSEAKLCLAYIMSGQVPPHQLAHYRLLLARLLSAQGDNQAALAQCDAILASHSSSASLCSLAAHLAAQQAKKLNVITSELNYLKQLVQGLKTGSTKDFGHFGSFEEACLLTLSQRFSISLPEATYLLARQLYLAGYHVRALDSYKELLEVVKSETPEASLLLPCRSQLVQECVLAHIKTNSLSGGEQLCRELVSHHTPHSGGVNGSCSVWEKTLYSMEDNVIGLLLLADILTASGNKRKALEELNRCQSALSEWREQARSATDTQLCDWLLSRVLLRKAKISSTTDAVHYFRRALSHKPGDKEVMFHYKQWSLWHPDHESFDPGDAAAAVTFPVDDIHDLAVRHVLGCSVVEEEWNHLFDQETSQNIIESLFDDDD